MKHTVFVYGTLREGHNNHYLLQTSKWLDYSTTNEDYAMFASGIPFVSKNISLHKIKGEVYEVSDDTLEWLDQLEGHPHAYKREQVDVTLNFNKKTVKAWLYFYDDPRGKIVESGDYNDYAKFVKEKNNEKINKRRSDILRDQESYHK